MTPTAPLTVGAPGNNTPASAAAADRDGLPIIGIAPDVTEPAPGKARFEVAMAYIEAVCVAGGLPTVLAPIVALIPEQLAMCDGIVLTGGNDPRTEPFGEPTHPRAKPVHPLRQEYETALLRALMIREDIPALGICLGMQMMALVAGGRLEQSLSETLPTHAEHAGNQRHAVRAAGGMPDERWSGEVASSHRQAVAAPGALRVIARAEDGVIEAIDRPARCAGAAMFVGVQWHPERTLDRRLGIGVFEQLIEAARAARAAKRGATGGRA